MKGNMKEKKNIKKKYRYDSSEKEVSKQQTKETNKKKTESLN